MWSSSSPPSVKLSNGVLRSVEEVDRFGSVELALKEIVELEPELLSELPQRRVALIDELASMLADLAVEKHVPDRPAATAHAVRPLVDRGVDSSLLEPVGGGQTGE